MNNSNGSVRRLRDCCGSSNSSISCCNSKIKRHWFNYNHKYQSSHKYSKNSLMCQFNYINKHINKYTKIKRHWFNYNHKYQSSNNYSQISLMYQSSNKYIKTKHQQCCFRRNLTHRHQKRH